MASLQAYQSHGIRYYRIVESFRKDGKPSIRVLSDSVKCPLAGGCWLIQNKFSH